MRCSLIMMEMPFFYSGSVVVLWCSCSVAVVWWCSGMVV